MGASIAPDGSGSKLEGLKPATYLRDQDVVTGSNAHGKARTVLVDGTRANGEDLGLVLLLDAALGEEDTGGGLGLGLDALDQDAVEKGSKTLDVTEERLIDIITLAIDIHGGSSGLAMRSDRG